MHHSIFKCKSVRIFQQLLQQLSEVCRWLSMQDFLQNTVTVTLLWRSNATRTLNHAKTWKSCGTCSPCKNVVWCHYPWPPSVWRSSWVPNLVTLAFGYQLFFTFHQNLDLAVAWYVRSVSPLEISPSPPNSSPSPSVAIRSVPSPF